MSEFAIQFLNSEDQPITQETVAEVVEGIRKDRISDAWLGLDEYGEEEFLSVDLRDGWAAICFNTYEGGNDAHMYMPVNPAYADSESNEDSPVDIGGQTPIGKRNALDDLNLAADCVYHVAKTGELYPGVKWEKDSLDS